MQEDASWNGRKLDGKMEEDASWNGRQLDGKMEEEAFVEDGKG